MKKTNTAPLGYVRKEYISPLFWLCWLAYFAANMGRLSYTASIAMILQSENIPAATGGLISTGFFICYGVGQLFSGYIGDKANPQHMVLTGLVLTAACNVLLGLTTDVWQMVCVWSANGLIQSMLWPPILRILAECFPPKNQKKACVNIATTYPVATLAAYLLSAAVATNHRWQQVFFITCGILACSAICWLIFFRRLTRKRIAPSEPMAVTEDAHPRHKRGRAAYPVAALCLFCGAMIMQGALRDGLTTWVPTYLSRNFGVSVASATMLSIIIPLVNMLGVFGANQLYRRMPSESRVSCILFAAACAGAVILTFSGNLILSLLSFALITACMMGVNLMLVSFVPTYFAAMRKVAFISGITNAMVYVGSSISTFGFGWVADTLGWRTLLIILVALTLAGTLLCLVATPLWQRFRGGRS